MSIARIAGRYAKSLLELAQETNKLDQVKSDMTAFGEAVQLRDFYTLLKSPIINTGKKRSIIKEIFGGKLDELTMSFLNIILTKGREAYLPEIAEAFEDQYKKLKGVTSVKLTTATQLSDELVQKIKANLESSSSTDQSVEIETAVDPDLIGGFVFEFGDRLYDASVAHRLEVLRKELVK